MHIPLTLTNHPRVKLLVFFTCLLLFIGRQRHVRALLDQLFFTYQTHFSSLVRQPVKELAITPQLFLPFTLAKSNAVLEQKVRSLEIKNSTQQEEIRRLKQLNSATANMSSREGKEYTHALITKSASNWIVSGGSKEGVQEHSPIFISGGYVGYIVTPSDHASTAWIWLEEGSRIGVLHQKSRALGVMQTQKEGIVVDFFSRVESLEKNDILLTVGDTPGIPVAVPIAVVEDSITKDSDPVTRIKAKPLTILSPGDIVQIEKK